jgi:putative hemolysin
MSENITTTTEATTSDAKPTSTEAEAATSAGATAEVTSTEANGKAATGEGTEQRKPTVLDAEDIGKMVPFFGRHPKLTNWLIKFLELDKVNKVHADNCHTPGPKFVRGLLHDFDITVVAENGEVLQNLPEGAFITVSNHHFGALDGIILVDLIARRRPKYKVMVNMFLNYIWAMRPNFIAVDAMATNDPKKKAVSMAGIKEAIKMVRSGDPVGFFPAGAVGKVNWRGRLKDRQWQDSIIRLAQQLKVPVVPIFFHGSQSWFFNFLGIVCWQARTLCHPHEVFNKLHSTFTVTVGDPISFEEQKQHMGSVKEYGDFLRERTYGLRDNKEIRSRAKLVTTPDGKETLVK